MRKSILLSLCSLALLCPALAQKAAPATAARPAVTAEAAAADVKIGLGVEKYEVTGAAETFKVAAGTRIYAWTRVTGVQGTEDAPAAISIAFIKDGKTVFQQKLDVKRSPYRTNAFRTFRAGDAGAWTAKVLDTDGKELGSADFQVELEG